jgi:integrase
MARIQKRQTQSGATTYVVKWRTPDGHDRSKGGFRTRKAAQAYATTAEATRLRGATFDPQAGNTTFRAAAQAWLASRHDLKPTTLAEHRCALAPVARRRGDGKVLGIDATFGGYPLNAITREQISEWVARLTQAGKNPSTVRYNYGLVRQVLAAAVADNALPSNPADYVKLPPKAATAVDAPTSFLSAQQVSAIVAATPWPYNIYVHLAAWAGLRAAELAGLQVADVELPPPALNPNTPNRPGLLHVRRTARPLDGVVAYMPPKTKGSTRRVPLTPATTELLADYLAEHPYGPGSPSPNPTAPLFPAMAWLGAQKRNAALANQPNVDWAEPLRHSNFYQSVFKPAVVRAGGPPVKFHALRHTYASLCVAAGIAPLQLSRFMGHTNVTITLTVYAHLFADDHSEAMAALGAMGTPLHGGNVIPMHA